MIRSNFRGGGKCCKKEFLWDFVKFPGKHLYSLILLFIKKEILAQVFCCEFNKILQISFFTEHRRTTASVLLSFTICDQKVLIPSFHLKLIHFSLHKK